MDFNIKEGEVYDFIISGELQLPDDDYYVLKASWGEKYLLPQKYYQDYNLHRDKIIKCKIDKINCTGKIFLEPEHPFYIEGGVYEFDFESFGEIRNSLGELEKVLIVRDVFLNKIQIPFDSKKKVLCHSKIKCKVLRIKKARLLLTLLDAFSENILEEGKEYQLIISGITTLSDKNEYYILKDEQGNVLNLRKKYYETYDFSMNQVINCRVNKDLGGKVFLEPQHPFYKIGNSYNFKLLKTDKKININDEEIIEILVSDKFLNKIKFTTKKKILLNSSENFVKCKLVDIRKGRLFLKID